MPLLILLAFIAFIVWAVFSFAWWAITGTADLLGGWFNLLLVAAGVLLIVHLARKEK
jgi:hypothetical protein